MRTVGQILKETREEKLLSLDEVEKATKIRKELLQALENDRYDLLPPPTFVQGFIKNYARYLSIDSGKLLAIYRREFAESKHQPYVMDAFANPNKEHFSITPGKILGGVITLIILSFFVYLWFQYRSFVGSPALTLESPPDQFTTKEMYVLVQGKTDPEVKVLVNSQEIPVEESGDFKEEIALSSQMNKITVEAVSKFGQKVEIVRTVYLSQGE